jgi:hypothetical protein
MKDTSQEVSFWLSSWVLLYHITYAIILSPIQQTTGRLLMGQDKTSDMHDALVAVGFATLVKPVENPSATEIRGD